MTHASVHVASSDHHINANYPAKTHTRHLAERIKSSLTLNTARVPFVEILSTTTKTNEFMALTYEKCKIGIQK